MEIVYHSTVHSSTNGHGNNVSASKEEMEKYMDAAKVEVYNFVSVKLSGRSNYRIWKDQMLSLLDKLTIREIVDEDRQNWLESKSEDLVKKYDILLKGWILASLNEEVLKLFDYWACGHCVWVTLEGYMAKSANVSVSEKQLEEYMRASNVNVSNFVSVKLSGSSNYPIWKVQMLLLMDKLMIRDIVENRENWFKSMSEDFVKKYDILLKGWILCSLNEELLRHIDYSACAHRIWVTLEDEYRFRWAPSETVLLKVREDYDHEAPLSETSIVQCKLRDATREGNWWRAQSILRKNSFEVTIKINNIGETMLHLAVAEGKNYFVHKLLNSRQNEKLIEEKNNKGQTALHIAALVGNTYAAELLVKKREDLLNVKDNLGKVPLLVAYTTNHISTLKYLLEVTKKADDLLSKDNDSFEEFIVRLIYRKEYVLAVKLYRLHLKSTEKPTDKVLMELTRNFPNYIGFGEALIYPSWENVGRNLVKRSSLLFYSIDSLFLRAEHTLWRLERFKNNCYSWWLPEIVILLLVPIAVLYPLYQLILLLVPLLLLPLCMLYSLTWKVLTTVVAPIKDIEKRKKEYEEALYFLNDVVRYIDSCNLDKSLFYKFIALEAVRLDVYEVLRVIISHFNQTIEYTNERHNIIQLAIIYRSGRVYTHILYPLIKQKESLRVMRDYSGNNLLHLVGRLAPSKVLNCTTGPALQILRELYWREEVMKFMEPEQLTDLNIDNETPEEVFTREHADLVKDGENWMKTTAESCSITAALIVTIVFAAAITVPGGSNQETGIPLFKKQIAFTVFAISDAISLFTASTSLLVFLSILTTRFAEKDFLLILPRRLLIAFFMLFLSTSTMMLAFSAILFLVFCDQRPWMLAPIGVFTCMPITAIVSLQLPRVVEFYLIWFYSH